VAFWHLLFVLLFKNLLFPLKIYIYTRSAEVAFYWWRENLAASHHLEKTLCHCSEAVSFSLYSVQFFSTYDSTMWTKPSFHKNLLHKHFLCYHNLLKYIIIFWPYSAFARQVLCSSSHSNPVLFILDIGSSFMPRLDHTMTLLFYSSYHSWDDRLLPLCPAIGWNGVNCLPGLALNHNPLDLCLPIS
jgi:hypothetical protein